MCLSVCQRSRHCTTTAKLRITQTTPYDSAKILCSVANDLGEIPTGSPLAIGAPNRGGVGSNRRFSTNISVCLKNGVRHTGRYYGTLIRTSMRSIKLRILLFSVTLSDHNHPKTPDFCLFVSPFIFSQRVEIETSNLVGRLIVQVLALETILEKDVARSRKPYKVWWVPTTSLERLMLVRSNFVQM